MNRPMYSAGATRAILLLSACQSAEYLVFPAFESSTISWRRFFSLVDPAQPHPVSLDRTSSVRIGKRFQVSS